MRHTCYWLGLSARAWPALLFPLCALLLAGCMSVDLASLLQPRMEERTVQEAKGWTGEKIALIDVTGIISSSEGGALALTAHCTPEQVKAALNRAERDGKVKAVVLRIDSPGGSAAASDLIYHEIKSFRARTHKPVVAALMGLACSGGYYAACGADHIYAQPSTITGSIGVIARFPRMVKLADKVGYEEVIFKSGPLKDMGHPLRDFDPASREVMQGTVDALYGQFLAAVLAARPAYTSAELLRPVADGRIYTAAQAVDLHLVDGIAYLPEVITQAMAEAGLKDAKVVSYRAGNSGDANIYSRAGTAAPMLSAPLVNLDLGSLFGGATAGFYYLWLP